jgi:hypothetical protein
LKTPVAFFIYFTCLPAGTVASQKIDTFLPAQAGASFLKRRCRRFKAYKPTYPK